MAVAACNQNVLLPPVPPTPELRFPAYRRPMFGGPRNIRANACGIAPPTSVAEWWRQSDAVVRVRINSHSPYDDLRDVTYRPNILSRVEATVLDAFKLHRRGVGPGATMTITHPGGTMMRIDGAETHTTNDFPPPTPGTEWFLFLSWREDRQEFWIAYLDQGAFQVVDDALIRPRDLGLSLPERTPEALAEVLEQFARTNPAVTPGK